MANEIIKRELQEAIKAGEQALKSLKAAREKLNSAKNWGMFDMFGGGFLSSVIKHSKMDDASVYIEDAKHSIQIFQRELQDINVPLDVKMEVGGFLSFADFFFDGFIVDYMVQSKISDSKEQIEDAIFRVESLLIELKAQYE